MKQRNWGTFGYGRRQFGGKEWQKINYLALARMNIETALIIPLQITNNKRALKQHIFYHESVLF